MAATTSRWLITGASGQLGSYLLRAARTRELAVVPWSHRTSAQLFGYACQPVDLGDTASVAEAFAAAKPTVVVHAAALSRIGDCFQDPAHARRINTAATRLLAELAEQHSARLVYVSTDLVFDGSKGWYREHDCPAPLSVYGRTKADAERCVVAHGRNLALRVSLLFGPALNERPSFFNQQIEMLRAGAPCTLFEDEWRTPLDLQTAADAILRAAGSDVTGLLHVGGPERMSRLEMGLRLAGVLGADKSHVKAVSRCDISAAEPRPCDTSLCCALWQRHFPDAPRPGFEEALRAMGLGSE